MSFSIYGLEISLPLVGAVAAILVGRELWTLTYFWRRSIKSPTPLPLFGNVLSCTKGFNAFLYACKQKYGEIFGFYLFKSPVIVISDPDMLKDILIKSFSKFPNHMHFPLKNRPLDQGLLDLSGQRWKDVRNVITPSFSALKMKQMSPLINECCDILVANLEKKQGSDVNVNSVFEAFTMDGIAKVAFGLQVDSQNNPADPFVKHGKAIMDASVNSPVAMISGVFPSIAKVFNAFDIAMFPGETRNFFRDVVVKAMDIRKHSVGNDKKDFLQLMMNAHNDEEHAKGTNKNEVDNDLHNLIEERHNRTDSKSTKAQLTTEEIFAQALLFFAAGYETTNVTLGFLAYALATNPEVQDQLIEEVDEMTPTRDSVDYNSVAKMQLLDGVVCETLRLYPPAPMSDRVCDETHTCNGLTIEKGIHIFYSIFSIHYDPTLWPEPEKFDPSRFTKENRAARHPCAWIPFGAGPRNCIGMRFALMEVKMALVRILQEYRFKPSPNSEIPVKFGSGNTLKPDGGIVLRVEERK